MRFPHFFKAYFRKNWQKVKIKLVLAVIEIPFQLTSEKTISIPSMVKVPDVGALPDMEPTKSSRKELWAAMSASHSRLCITHSVEV